MRNPAPLAKRVAVPNTSYPLWLPKDQAEVIKAAQQTSGKNWTEWVASAFKRFREEPAEEIEVLVQTWVKDRSGKVRMNVRIADSCLAEIDELCAKIENSSKQACLQHALFIYALRAGVLAG